jgi:hypothetical protein
MKKSSYILATLLACFCVIVVIIIDLFGSNHKSSERLSV